jgi:hypothetical protein
VTVKASGSDDPQIVYHYTNAAGLLGILSRKELWQGDVEVMNDAQELEFIVPPIVSDLTRKADMLWPSVNDDPEQSAEWCRAQIVRMIVGFLTRSIKNAEDETYHVYATCFCEDSDLLSQWRGYAGEGGYAVGFYAEALKVAATREVEGVEQSCLARIHYGLDSARAALDALVGNLAMHAKAHYSVESWHQFMQQVLPLVSTVKHPSFAEEREWRLLSLSWGLEGDLEFRAGRLGLIPYRRFPIPVDSVANVTVGPGYHPEVRQASVVQYLRKHGFKDADVRLSNSPLRP